MHRLTIVMSTKGKGRTIGAIGVGAGLNGAPRVNKQGKEN